VLSTAQDAASVVGSEAQGEDGDDDAPEREATPPTMWRWVSRTHVLTLEEEKAKEGIPSDAAPPKTDDSLPTNETSATNKETRMDGVEGPGSTGEASSPEPTKSMAITFGVPVGMLTPENTAEVSPRAERPAAPICAVQGCGATRKYRLVKDWTQGACGLSHLKTLESRLA
jgi:Ino eighty subunit 2